jgi:hypothetical protein
MGIVDEAVDAPQIQMMLRMPELRLMSLARAEAYTRIFPYLSRILLPKGAIDLSHDIPLTDVEMVAPTAALVAHEDLHPALVGLLVQAAKEVHSAGGMFHRAGEFPTPNDPEFELSPDADRIYKSGPPFLQRYLPFWVATYIERAKVLILPIAVVLLPALKLAPLVYRWRIRRRLLYWYEQIRELEHKIASDPERTRLDEHRSDMARIERGITSMPLHEQYYMLIAAIDHVRNRLA